MSVSHKNVPAGVEVTAALIRAGSDSDFLARVDRVLAVLDADVPGGLTEDDRALAAAAAAVALNGA